MRHICKSLESSVEMQTYHEVIVNSLCFDLSILHDSDVVSEGNEVDCVSEEDSRLAVQEADEDLVKDFLADLAVKS